MTLTRERIIEGLRDRADPDSRAAADLIERDGRALAATSQSEYERELEERLKVVTDRLDAMTVLLADALAGLELVERRADIADLCAEIRSALKTTGAILWRPDDGETPATEA